jgi:hypothetical protein
MRIGRALSFDHMAVGCVVIAGFVEATQQALKGAPDFSKTLPNIFNSENLNYVPFVLLVVGGVMWILGRKTKPELLAGQADLRRFTVTGVDRIQSMMLDVQHEWEQVSRAYDETVAAWNAIHATREKKRSEPVTDEEISVVVNRLFDALELWRERLLRLGRGIKTERDSSDVKL